MRRIVVVVAWILRYCCVVAEVEHVCVAKNTLHGVEIVFGRCAAIIAWWNYYDVVGVVFRQNLLDFYQNVLRVSVDGVVIGRWLGMKLSSGQTLWSEELAWCIGYEGVECGVILLVGALNAVWNVGGGILQGEHAVHVVIFVKLIFYELWIFEHVEELQVKVETVELWGGFVVLHIQKLVFNGAFVAA